MKSINKILIILLSKKRWIEKDGVKYKYLNVILFNQKYLTIKDDDNRNHTYCIKKKARG